MTIRIASCHCADVLLTCLGAPSRVSMCHCLDCQRRTGSAFSVAVFYPRASVTITQGETRSFARSSASGFAVTFHFCPRCGSNVWWEAARMPDRIAVAIGAFADPDFPMPEQSVWTGDKHHWLDLHPQIVTRFESTPR